MKTQRNEQHRIAKVAGATKEWEKLREPVAIHWGKESFVPLVSNCLNRRCVNPGIDFHPSGCVSPSRVRSSTTAVVKH